MAQQEVTNGAAAVEVVSFSAMKPQLFVGSAKVDDAVSFYEAAFGAVEVGRTTQPKRKSEQELPCLVSAQLHLAGSTITVSGDSAAVKTEGSAIVLCLETENVEAAISKAVAAGAVAEGEICEGEGACGGGGRVGKVKDPYGFVWMISSSSSKKARADVEA